MNNKKQNTQHFLCNDNELNALNYLVDHADIPGVQKRRNKNNKSQIIRAGIKELVKRHSPPAVYKRFYGGELLEQEKLNLLRKLPTATLWYSTPKPVKKDFLQIIAPRSSIFEDKFYDQLIQRIINE